MNHFSSAVKVTINDIIAYAFKCSSEMQNYLEKVLVNNIEREVKQSNNDGDEEVINTLLLAKDELETDEHMQEMIQN